MPDHDPLCSMHNNSGNGTCRCDLIRKVRADERKKVADAWATGGWTVLTEKVRSGSVLGAAQAVTDWLRAR